MRKTLRARTALRSAVSRASVTWVCFRSSPRTRARTTPRWHERRRQHWIPKRFVERAGQGGARNAACSIDFLPLSGCETNRESYRLAGALSASTRLALALPRRERRGANVGQRLGVGHGRTRNVVDLGLGR